MGDHEEAIAELRQAERLTERSGDPRLPFLARAALATNLLELGRYAEAEELLPEVRAQAERLGNELDRVRVLWLQARVGAALGRRQEALAALEQVRRYFTAKRIAFDAALATLEVAVLELERGRSAEVKRLAAGMLWIFEAQGVHQEALAALRLFREAAEKEEATAGLARQIVEYLNRARYRPGLAFGEPEQREERAPRAQHSASPIRPAAIGLAAPSSASAGAAYRFVRDTQLRRRTAYLRRRNTRLRQCNTRRTQSNMRRRKCNTRRPQCNTHRRQSNTRRRQWTVHRRR